MKRNMMGKNLRQTVWKTLGRYIAIVAIIALGCAIFVGLRITKTDMVATGQAYTDRQNMFDLRLMNTYGWDKADISAIAAMEGILDAEGMITLDVFGRFSGRTEDSVYRLHSITQRVDKVYLLGGRMPQSSDECLVDGAHMDDSVLGTTFTVADSNEADTLDALAHREYTVVGYVSTPLYMDMTRGTTTIGNGTLASYVYLPEDAFLTDYYTEIHVTLPGEFSVYTESYNAAMEDRAEALKPLLSPLAQTRFRGVKQEAEKAYADGLREYEDGLREYEEGKQTAETELQDALQKLLDAQAEIDENKEKLESGEVPLAEAEQLLRDSEKELDQARIELEKAKADAYDQMAAGYEELLASYKQVTEALTQVNDGLGQINDGLSQINDGLGQIEDGLSQLEIAITLTQSQISATKTALENAENWGLTGSVDRLEQELAAQEAQLQEYEAQKQTALETQAELTETKAELEAQKAELEETKKTLDTGLNAINAGFKELETGKAIADSQFASASAQLQAGILELEAGKKELAQKRTELEEGKQALEDGIKELEDGFRAYEEGKLEAETELSDGAKKLEEAKQELADARKTLDDMKEPEVFALTRETNMGYMALDSNSDIVYGIAKVFPAFFLLVAALVCITTMTRMVEEERTQIGTLKALGYGQWAIISKYLYYSASAAVLGCGLGVAAGSVVFPWILWDAYGIIFNIQPDCLLMFDWKLSLAICGAYIAVSSLVTWYCCRRVLQEVPAELIRPKAPASGKKILLERLPLWNKLSFLNKVMLRNVVRYRQRLLMMLVGIGGCTALLLTGFGIRDSIVDIVNVQFEEITRYDMQLTFSEGQSEESQALLRRELGQDVEEMIFCYQTSVELEYGGKNRSIFLVSSREDISPYIHMHSGETEIAMPGRNEAVISTGVSELMGIALGDSITVRTNDLEVLELTVSGIYDNHVYNYVIVEESTLAAQWGTAPESQSALLNLRSGVDAHALGAELSSRQGVMNLMVCQDQADQVNSMMDAMDVVVMAVIISAGLLGATVLYNLTNINITERIREIATIKVLGFNAGETSAYVFKENILLSVLGACVGLLGGKLLLDFVMTQIKIDMVWFQSRVTVLSYVGAVVLTLLTAVFVDFIFHFRLQKINMAEALKSVE